MRPTVMLCAFPVLLYAPLFCGLAANMGLILVEIDPIMTAVRVSPRESGMPACSSASQAQLQQTGCRNPSPRASRVIPHISLASKPATSGTKPPHLSSSARCWAGRGGKTLLCVPSICRHCRDRIPGPRPESSRNSLVHPHLPESGSRYQPPQPARPRRCERPCRTRRWLGRCAVARSYGNFRLKATHHTDSASGGADSLCRIDRPTHFRPTRIARKSGCLVTHRAVPHRWAR